MKVDITRNDRPESRVYCQKESALTQCDFSQTAPIKLWLARSVASSDSPSSDNIIEPWIRWNMLISWIIENLT